MEKFKTPCELPNAYEREVLNILIEECAEVQQRATKMLRFGRDEIQPEQPLSNLERLSDEVGDLQAMIELAKETKLLSPDRVSEALVSKRKKLWKYMQQEQAHE